MNSIIEGQITFEEEVIKEIQRCKEDLHYMYLNYYIIDGKLPENREEDKVLFDYWKKIQDNPNILGVIDLKLGRHRNTNPTLNEAETKAFEEWRKNNKPKTRRRNNI